MAAPKGAPQPAGTGATAAALTQVKAPATMSATVQVAVPAEAWTVGLTMKTTMQAAGLAGARATAQPAARLRMEAR